MFRKCTAAYYKTIQMHPNQESFMLTTHPVLHDMLPIHYIRRGDAFPASPRLKSCSFLFVSQNRVQYKPAYFSFQSLSGCRQSCLPAYFLFCGSYSDRPFPRKA